MAFSKCPECGETNYFEAYSSRTFDCGFEGFFDNTRTKRCDAAKKRQAKIALDPALAANFNAESARYRLALLDAAQVADVLASDMDTAHQDARFATRCRDLARQMREFAGHTANAADFSDLASKAKSSGGLLSIVRRVKPW